MNHIPDGLQAFWVHVYRYIYIYKEFLSRCKNRNSLGMWQKNQMKIQDRGEGNVLEKS